MTNGIREILLSQRFFPEYGGSITWLFETYSRWPTRAHLITHKYALGDASIDTPQSPNIVVERHDILLSDWGLDSLASIVRYLRMCRAVYQQLRAAKSIVRVHCTHIVPEATSLLLLKMVFRNRLQILCYAHGEEILACQSSRQLQALLKCTARYIDIVVANSRHTAELLGPYVSQDKVHVIHPGVSYQSFADADPQGASWRASRQIRDEDVVLVSFGRLESRKNHHTVIDAVAELADRCSELRYYIVGTGAEEAALKARVAELQLADRVHFIAPVNNQEKTAIMGGCDVFVMPSISSATDTEGFGMVFLEAAAAGKPSIAGAVGGQPEAVLHEETGLVVDGNDKSAVAEAIVRLYEDRQLREKLGKGAREFAAQFDWPKVVDRTYRLVHQKLG